MGVTQGMYVNGKPAEVTAKSSAKKDVDNSSANWCACILTDGIKETASEWEVNHLNVVTVADEYGAPYFRSSETNPLWSSLENDTCWPLSMSLDLSSCSCRELSSPSYS